MRILVWITLGFAAGCWTNGYQLLNLEPFASVVLLFSAALLFWIGNKRKSYRVAAWILLGCSWSLIWYQGYTASYLRNASALDGETAYAEIALTDFSFETPYGRGADGSLELEGKSYSVRLYLEEGEELSPDTRVKGEFRFRLTTPDSQDGVTSHSGKGIFLLAYQEDAVTIETHEIQSFLVRASYLRRHIQDILRDTLPKDVYPFSIALLLGDTSELTYETDTQLKLSGIRHVAAVSGMHVSILFALAMQIAFRKRFASSLIGLPVLLLFAAVAGFTPSVNRACIMCALMLLALLFNQEYDGLTALAFSALVMLLWNPLVITHIGFQLSCASVAGIFLFSESIFGKVKSLLGDLKGKSLTVRLKRGIGASVATSLSAAVLTIPLCAFYFGTVSLIGPITNLLTLWIITGIFYVLMVVTMLGLLYPAAAVFLGKMVAIPIRLVLFTAGSLAEFPIASVYLSSDYIVFWLIFVYILLGVSVCRKQKLRITAICGTLGLCMALLFSWTEPLLHDTSITVLDVGQGQCILLQSGGKSWLIDCGGDQDTQAADAAAGLLLSQGITRLDGLVLTHTDRDHAGGLEYLLTRIDTDLLILPPIPTDLDTGSTDVIYSDRELILTWGTDKLHIYGEQLQHSDNENSLCILLDTEKCDILITGDRNARGEVRLLRSLANVDVDILVAGHHGSQYAASEDLLRAVTPEIVCISVGEDNIYGHPAPETLNRLYRQSCRVYRTDIHGTITIRR